MEMSKTSNNSSHILEMRFDPNVITHLGIQMYSTLPPVISELVSNAYDADATRVVVRLNDNLEEKSIVIEDDGHGMSFNEINEKFLIIGRNRRKSEGEKSRSGKRFVVGKKGIGKLAFSELPILSKFLQFKITGKQHLF